MKELLLLSSLLGLSLAHLNLNQSKYNIGWAKFLEDEPTEFHNLPLTWEAGGVPAWIKGSYVKNGPAQHKFGAGERWYANYMDSWGKLIKITFKEDGSVLYSGRMIETENYLKCAEEERLVPTITAAAVRPNDWTSAEFVEAIINNYDNTNVILWRLGPEDINNATYMATTDYPLVHFMDPESLAVTGKHKWMNLQDGISAMSSSHWRRVVGSDDSLNFHQKVEDFLNPFHPMVFHLYRYGRTIEEVEEIAKFHVNFASYIHMMSNTPRYAVVILYPVTMNNMKLPEHNWHPIETIEKKDEPCRIKLVDLVDGSIIDFETEDPSMVFATHIANSWEEGEEEVVIDLATNPWDAMTTYTDLETMLDHPETDAEVGDQVMKRVRLVMSTKEVIVEEYPNESGIPMMNTFDFPTINDKYSGYKHRYIYGWVTIDYWRQTLVKRDLEDPSGDYTWFKPSHYPGEMFFIPNPEGVEEDDGVLITLVFDGEREQSYVMILDAKTFEEIDIAYLPYNVPFSFHGNWFPEIF